MSITSYTDLSSLTESRLYRSKNPIACFQASDAVLFKLRLAFK